LLLINYLRTLNQFRSFVQMNYPQVTGPNGVTQEMAERWRDNYGAGTYKRGDAGQERSRSNFTLDTKLGTLRAIWGTWFKDHLKIIFSNPFERVEGPTLDDLNVVVPTDEDVAHFKQWLHDRFNGWLPLLFFDVKEHCANRLFDLCAAKASWLANGNIMFATAIVKNRKDRSVPLPKALYDEMKAVAGPTFIWERFNEQLRPILKAKGWPQHQLAEAFDPRRFYDWIEALTVHYRRATGKKMNTHAFRKRAFTGALENDIDPCKAAIAFGVGVETMMKHYVIMNEQATTNDVYAIISKNGGISKNENDPHTTPTQNGEFPHKIPNAS